MPLALLFWCCCCFFFFLCNSTYVGNKVGIYFSVNRGSCVSRQLPMPSWPMPLIKKPLLALVSLSKSPSSHLCVSVCVRGSLPKRTCQLNGYHWDGGVQHNFVFVFMFFNLYSYILNHKYAQLEWCCLFFSHKSLLSVYVHRSFSAMFTVNINYSDTLLNMCLLVFTSNTRGWVPQARVDQWSWCEDVLIRITPYITLIYLFIFLFWIEAFQPLVLRLRQN